MFDLSRPVLMGIVNVTPDSFFDGGRHYPAPAAIAHARRLVEAGAALVDVGGESTRPGAPPVPADEELRRVLPVVEALCRAGIVVSVDTSKPDVMRAVLAAGATVINDVNALRAPGAVDAVAGADCGVVLMHMRGDPRTMQDQPVYADVVAEVGNFLRDRLDHVARLGIAPERVVIDPGFGFGKTVAHNYELLERLGELLAIGRPLLAGLSNKSMLGALTGQPAHERTTASVAASLIAVERGARVLRVHDVAAMREAVMVWCASRGLAAD